MVSENIYKPYKMRIADIREEVSRLLVELNQTTDRNIGLMEDRIASLNEQLVTADKKIALLRREIEKHDVGTQVYSRLVEARPPRLATPEPTRPAAGGMPPGVAASEAAALGVQPALVERTSPRSASPAPALSVELSDRSA